MMRMQAVGHVQCWLSGHAPVAGSRVRRRGRTLTPRRRLPRPLPQSGAYCGELHAQWCDLGPTKWIGDFGFTQPLFGRDADVGKQTRALQADKSPTLFFYGYYRCVLRSLASGSIYV